MSDGPIQDAWITAIPQRERGLPRRLEPARLAAGTLEAVVLETVALAAVVLVVALAPGDSFAENAATKPASLAASVAGIPSAPAQSTDAAPDPSALSDPKATSKSVDVVPDDQLTGRQIYKRVLDNRYDTFIQTSRLISGDRGGHEQDTQLRMWFQNKRDAEGNPTEGTVLSKSLVRYLAPFDMRHTGYLVINNLNRANDQFVYMNSSRKVRRVNLRGEAVFGTDFSFEDVIPKELEDAKYERLEDDTARGRPCFVVEATPIPEVESQYSRIRVWVEKERPVVLQTYYWDDRGIHIKELEVDPDAIDLVNGVYVPRRSTMRHLKMESYTTLDVTEIEPNIVMRKSDFDLTRLQGH